MFNNVFRDTKNERLGLLIATAIFGLIGVLQLWRAFTGMPVELGGYSVPVLFSVVAGVIALVMSMWIGVIFRRNRPML